MECQPGTSRPSTSHLVPTPFLLILKRLATFFWGGGSAQPGLDNEWAAGQSDHFVVGLTHASPVCSQPAT